MSFRGAVAPLTSHGERKVGTSLFSCFVYLCADDVEGKHRKKRKTERRKKEGKTRGRKRKVGKVVRSEGPCCPSRLHLFCI